MSEKLPAYVTDAMKNYSHMKAIASGPIGRYGNASQVQANVDDALSSLEAAIRQYGDEREHKGYERASSLLVPP